MNCVISSGCIKVMGRAFHSISKFADSIFIEANQDHLQYHAINSSQSGYSCFTFSKDYFACYECISNVKRKISMKSLFLAFKSLSTMEKNLEKCTLEMEAKSDHLIVCFHCKSGIVKNYVLPYIDDDWLNTNFNKRNSCNLLCANTRLFIEAVQNFPSTVDEVTLQVDDEKVILKNFIDDEPDPAKVTYTELTLEADEFITYKIQGPSSVTFCLKELRAMLNYADVPNLPMTIHFNDSGQPLVLNTHNIQGCEASFVLATLSTSDLTLDDTAKVKKGHKKKTVSKAPCNLSESVGTEQLIQETLTNKENGTAPSVVLNSDQPEKTPEQLLNIQDQNMEVEPQIEINNEELESLDDMVIPTTPPSKRFRSYFLGFSQQSGFTSMRPDPDKVLAPASDDESD